MPIRLIITILLLAAALILGFVFDWQKYQDFQLVQSEFEQKEAELNSKTAYYGKIQEIWEKLKGYQDVLSEIDSAVPRGYSVPVLFNYLRQTAGETGLVSENLTFNGIKGEEVKEIGLKLQASGSYSSLKNFLAALEGSARFFKVQNISVDSAQEKGVLSFDLEIATYSY